MRETENFFAELVAIVLMAWAFILIGLVWFLIKTGIEWIDQQAMLREAQAVFDRVRAEDYPDLQVDPLLRSIFGEDLDLPEPGNPNSIDWLIQAVYQTV